MQKLPEGTTTQNNNNKERKSRLGRCLAISTTIHAAVIGALNLPSIPLREKSPIEASAKTKTATAPDVETDTEYDKIPVEQLSEEDFEKLVAQKIQYLNTFHIYENQKDRENRLQKTKKHVIDMYERRLKIYNKELFEDLKDSSFQDDYAHFLIKTSVYHTNLEEFKKDVFDPYMTVSSLQTRWENIVERIKGVLQDLPKYTNELEKLNAIQKTVVLNDIVREYSETDSRFYHILLEKKGNCSSISDLSMALYQELIGKGHYFYLATVGHIVTAYIGIHGEKYWFENTQGKNQAMPFDNNTEKYGLVMPLEIQIMAYLLEQGYSLEDFPENLQQYWKKKKGTSQGGGQTDGVLGILPNRGYCIEGKEKCYSESNTTYDLKPDLQKDILAQFANIDRMSLAEILDSDFFIVEGGFSEKGSVGLFFVNFNVDKEKLRIALHKRINGDEVLQLSPPQMRKLIQFILLVDPMKYDEESIKRLVKNWKDRREQLLLEEMQKSHYGLRLSIIIGDYIEEFHKLPPLEIIKKLITYDRTFLYWRPSSFNYTQRPK